MKPASIQTVFDVITDFLASDPSPEDILAYRLPTELEKRAVSLLERHGNDELTYEEKQEMFDFVRADDMLTLLKAKIRMRLASGE